MSNGSSNGSIEELEERVTKLEGRVTELEKDAVVGLCRRIFRLESKLLVAGTVLTLPDPGGPKSQGVEQLNPIVQSLADGLPDFKMTLNELKEDFERCCVQREDDGSVDPDE